METLPAPTSVAARIPAARLGGAIEVRPVVVTDVASAEAVLAAANP